jgi:hypothetical protein
VMKLVTELQAKVAKLEEANEKRSGPKATREMTDDDARRITSGDLKDKSHTECAETLGLSYGQIYSARKGFTFKKVIAEAAKV